MKADLRCGRLDDALAPLEAEIRATETSNRQRLCRDYVNRIEDEPSQTVVKISKVR